NESNPPEVLKSRLDLNQWSRRDSEAAADHVFRANPRSVERFFAIGSRRSTHAAFHVGQPRAAATTRGMTARGTHRQVFNSDRSQFVELRRTTPDVNHLLPAYVAGRHGKLNAGVYIAVGRNVDKCVTCATWNTLGRVIRALGGSTIFFYIVD